MIGGGQKVRSAFPARWYESNPIQHLLQRFVSYFTYQKVLCAIVLKYLLCIHYSQFPLSLFSVEAEQLDFFFHALTGRGRMDHRMQRRIGREEEGRRWPSSPAYCLQHGRIICGERTWTQGWGLRRGDSEPQLATCPRASLSSPTEWELQLLPSGWL